jgi:hypothetical protein
MRYRGESPDDPITYVHDLDSYGGIPEAAKVG